MERRADIKVPEGGAAPPSFYVCYCAWGHLAAAALARLQGCLTVAAVQTGAHTHVSRPRRRASVSQMLLWRLRGGSGRGSRGGRVVKATDC